MDRIIFLGSSDLRRCGQYHPGTAAVPGVGRSGKGYPDLHQFPGRIGDGRSGNLRYDATGAARCGDHLHGTGRFDGRRAADRRCCRQALGAASFAGDDPSAAGRGPGAGIGHRDHGPRDPQDQAGAVRDHCGPFRALRSRRSKRMPTAIIGCRPGRPRSTG